MQILVQEVSRVLELLQLWGSRRGCHRWFRDSPEQHSPPAPCLFKMQVPRLGL